MRNLGEALLHAIARFPASIALCAVVGASATLAFGLSLPNQYRSVGLLLLRLGAREQQTPESAIADDVGTRGSTVATGDELLILRNPELHERVVDEVGARRILAPYDPTAEDGPNTPWHTRWMHAIQGHLVSQETLPELAQQRPPTELVREAAVRQLSKNISIGAQRHASTLVVAYTTHNAELAREVTSAYMRICQERHREVYGMSNELSFISRRLEEAEAEKGAAERALQERRDEDGVYDLRTLQDGLAEEIQALDAQIEQDTILLQSLGGQLKVIDERIAEVKPEPVIQVEQADPIPSGSSAMLTSRYEWLLAQHRDVNDEIAESDRTLLKGSQLHESENKRLKVRLDAIQQEIEEVEVRLAECDVTPPLPAEAVQPSVVYDGLSLQRVEIQRQQEGLRVGSEARAKLLQIRRERLSELVEKEPLYAELQLAITGASESTTRLRKARGHQRTLEALDSDESMTNLIVTQEATLPIEKEGPQRGKFLGMGLFAGLLLGLAQAVARHILDARLRYPRCVEDSLGIRVLGVVPEERRWRRHGNRLRRTAA